MPQKYSNRHLEPAKIILTLERLQARIEERFPDSGLASVCAEVATEARRVATEASTLSRPSWPLRIAVFALAGFGLVAQFAAARYFHFERVGESSELLQALEAAVNLLILFGGAVWFLLSLEERIKRRKALDGLYGLAALAHVVDMHQLTKDPTVMLTPHLRTRASPARTMTRFQLTRYLEYCAELLALIGKLAALYGERMRDSVVINVVNDTETLSTNLGRKIWQKIMIIGELTDDPTTPPPQSEPNAPPKTA